MQILAIETTDLSGSVSLAVDGREIASQKLPSQPRSAATLAAAVAKLFSDAGWKPADAKLIAVATGPGSFTGLRVGVTTAKLLAYATGAEVIGVNTMEVIAWQAPGDVDRVWTVIDAQRQQLFACEFARHADGTWHAVGVPQIYDSAHWLSSLAPGSVVSGPGLIKWKDQIPEGVQALAETAWQPRSATVGQLGWQHYCSGRRDDLWTLAPQYFRPSAAEEKAMGLSS